MTMPDLGPDPIDDATSGPIDDGPCDDCAAQMRQLSIIAAVVGAALGAGVAFVVLKNG